MKESAQQWLSNQTGIRGLIACGLRTPDGKLTCHSLDELCPIARFEKLLSQFDTLRTSLFTPEFNPRWSTWAFDQGRIRFVVRPDGWLLGLVVRADTDALARLDSLSGAFLGLNMAD